MKKNYIAPVLVTVEYDVEEHLLTGSGPEFQVKEGEGEDAANSLSFGEGAWSSGPNLWDDEE